VPPIKTHVSGSEVNNVVIVGAGQSGLGIALQLKLHLVDRVVLLDQNDKNCEGPWRTYARMERLLTPKWITGIDAGRAASSLADL
jgi:cation diffusion facilitator CzcD-associated flavoprotein CzcO